MITLSNEQQKVLDNMEGFLEGIENNDIPTKYKFLYHHKGDSIYVDMFPIVGHAGTGKTTLAIQVIEMLEKRKLNYLLLAPTHKAAKVISRKTKKPAYTMHSTLFSGASLRTSDNLEEFLLLKELMTKSQIEVLRKYLKSVTFSEDLTEEFVKKHLLDSFKVDLKAEEFTGNTLQLHFVAEGNKNFRDGEDGKLKTSMNDVIIIDEASMVDSYCTMHLAKLHTPIIFLGDDKQLPPIEPKKDDREGKGSNLLELLKGRSKDFVKLREVQRGSVVGKYGEHIRKHMSKGITTLDKYKNLVSKEGLPSDISMEEAVKRVVDDPKENRFISPRNATRQALNMSVINGLGGARLVNNAKDRQGNTVKIIHPVKGDILLLGGDTRPASQQLVSRNQEAEVLDCWGIFKEGGRYILVLLAYSEGQKLGVKVPLANIEGFSVIHSLKGEHNFAHTPDYPGDFEVFKSDTEIVYLRDVRYGFCLTAHTAQGSEYNNVFVKHTDYENMHPEAAGTFGRWFYTAITRGKENAYTIGGDDE